MDLVKSTSDSKLDKKVFCAELMKESISASWVDFNPSWCYKIGGQISAVPTTTLPSCDSVSWSLTDPWFESQNKVNILWQVMLKLSICKSFTKNHSFRTIQRMVAHWLIMIAQLGIWIVGRWAFMCLTFPILPFVDQLYLINRNSITISIQSGYKALVASQLTSCGWRHLTNWWDEEFNASSKPFTTPVAVEIWYLSKAFMSFAKMLQVCWMQVKTSQVPGSIPNVSPSL